MLKCPERWGYAIQRMDLIELLGFVMLVGAALSLILAWMAGRALTSPIRALQVASEGVGSGNLDLNSRMRERMSSEQYSEPLIEWLIGYAGLGTNWSEHRAVPRRSWKKLRWGWWPWIRMDECPLG
ncbi:MAG: hypothetical protein Ct9H300mP15_09490 [Gemmatimonadota bacterium]|nr:MAG: hypothetical protein Ct9H300mP15_09490 [Gemmatimonadota bacterium]